MSAYAVWIDQEQAKLFEFSNEKMERRLVRAHHPDHHTHRFENSDRQGQERHFFKEVAGMIENANSLLILGPGAVKLHFRNFLVETAPNLAKRVVGCETVDHPTDGQIAAFARRLFLAGS